MIWKVLKVNSVGGGNVGELGGKLENMVKQRTKVIVTGKMYLKMNSNITCYIVHPEKTMNNKKPYFYFSPT